MTLEQQLEEALKQIEIHECLAKLVAERKIETGIRDGRVVYWCNEDNVETNDILNKFFQ